MQSVSTIYKGVIFLFCLSFFSKSEAQDNSPWSRYGLGDQLPSLNIVNRGMGYTGAAYSDAQTINFLNPASYSQLGTQRSVFDIGLDINSRTIRNNKGSNYTSSNAYIPYFAGGFQLRGEKSKTNWGVVFGLRPLTKVSYNVIAGTKLDAGDSVVYNYEGSGGLYQAFFGTGIGIKNLSLGINGGYRFGSKDYTTRASILNDTSPSRYTSGLKEIRNNFGGAFLEGGMQYRLGLTKKTVLQTGVHAGLAMQMNFTRDERMETFIPASSGSAPLILDSVSVVKNIRGKIEYPLSYGFGFLLDHEGKGRLNLAADYSFTQWSAYRYDNTADFLQDAWTVKFGAQYLPDSKGSTKMKNSLLYRAGFLYGREPYTVDGNMYNYTITLGVGIPIKKYSYAEYNRSNVVNASLEFGQRSNRKSLLRENYIRLALSFSLSDIWFIKRKYD
ncbi:MAG: hypothetical protein ACK50E_01035 [Bacteroidota bacterium]|jgi:hypothetical protein